MHFRGYLLYRTLSKAKAKYRKRGNIFIYSHKYTVIYTASIFTKLIMALCEDLLYGIPQKLIKKIMESKGRNSLVPFRKL